MSCVADFTTSSVQSCHETDSAARAAQIMWEHDCGCVPIIDDDGVVIGIVTDRDICMAAYLRGKRLDDITAASAGSRDVVTVRGTEDVEAAEALMRKHQVRRLPVVDAEHKLRGMLSLGDLSLYARHAGDAAESLRTASIAETHAAICERPAARGKVQRDAA